MTTIEPEIADETVSVAEAERPPAARALLLARLAAQPAIELGRWNRDELYDEDRARKSRSV